jgi:hypothetical protein
MMEQQLATIDSCRFRALAEESAERLDMLGLLTKGSSRVKEQQDNPQAQQARNKKDMYSLMVHQKELEEKYEALQQRFIHSSQLVACDLFFNDTLFIYFFSFLVAAALS